jgi:hypothetical protein
VTLFVTWCTSTSTLNTSDWALYRVTSTSSAPLCSASGKRKWADYLTTSTPFCLPGTDAAHACSGVVKPTPGLPILHVTMPVDLKGPGATDSYNVVDDIALRNASRS